MQPQWRHLKCQWKKPDPKAILIHSCTIPFIRCSGKGRTMGPENRMGAGRGKGRRRGLWQRCSKRDFRGVSGTDPCLNHGSDMTPSICQKSEWPNTGKNFTVYKFKKEHDIKNSYQHSFPVCSAAKYCLCDPVDCSPPGSSVHGISQARVLEQVAISFSRGSSWLRNRTHMSCVGRWVLYCWATTEAQHSFGDAHFQQGFEAQSQSSAVTHCMFYAKMPLVSHSNTKCKKEKKQ